jgi:hypothetical protein
MKDKWKKDERKFGVSTLLVGIANLVVLSFSVKALIDTYVFSYGGEFWGLSMICWVLFHLVAIWPLNLWFLLRKSGPQRQWRYCILGLFLASLACRLWAISR